MTVAPVTSRLRHTKHELSDAKVVDHLSNAEERRHYQHPTESALEQCMPAFRSECTTKHTYTSITSHTHTDI